MKAAEGWQYTFKNVPLYKEGLGERIDYNAKEVKVPDGYRFVEDQNHQGIGPEEPGTETGGNQSGNGNGGDQGIGPEEPGSEAGGN